MTVYEPLTRENVDRLTLLAEMRSGFLMDIAWSSDGRNLAVAHGEGVSIWRDGFGDEPSMKIVGHDGPVRALAFSPDNLVLVTGGADMTVRMWVAGAGQQLAVQRGHADSVTSVAFNCRGTLLASGSANRSICLLNLTESARWTTLLGHEDEVTAVAFGAAPNALASASRDGTVRLWDAMTGRCRAVLRGHSDWVRDIAFSPDGRLLASAGLDRTIRLWDVTAGEGHTLYELEADARALTFSPDGALLAADDLGTIRLWDVERGNALAALPWHVKPILGLAFHPRGTFLVTISGDNTIKLAGLNGEQ